VKKVKIFSVFTLRLYSKLSLFIDSFNFLLYIADNGSMEGMTISEMAKELKIPRDTIKMRLHRANIKPFSQEALYTRADLEKIKNVKMGRPLKKKKSGKP
jgi:hypothetical protein